MTKSASQISAAVRSGETTARSVVEEHLARIAETDGDINAFNLVMTEEALQRADEIDRAVASGQDVGPLAGVPVGVKDNLCTKGVPTTCSSKILEGWRPPYDATVVERLDKAGAIVIGKTNLDEFAMGGSTEHSAFGPTRNPSDLERVAGGSSGGSAAAVAAGHAPIALGSDTGGSVRQPASYCGVVGMRPTYGTISRYGLVAFASSLDQVGPFGATVEDAALCLNAIAGYDAMDSTSFAFDVPDYTAALSRGVDGLRVGLLEEMTGDGISVDVRNAVESAAQVLERNGAKVGKASVPAVKQGLSAYYMVATAEASSNLARFDGIRYGVRNEQDDIFETFARTRTEGFGPEVKRRIMLGTYALSAGYFDAYYGKAQKVRSLIQSEFNKAYEQFDLLISPTAPTTAFKLGEIRDPLSMYLNDVCAVSTNLAGHGAMSVPFGADSAGLPIGVQLLGPAMSEENQLRAAAVLEGEAK
jgi:aspartyl-tRNA(Asn)/glutamyl-tRNA(Gln) amidotransferase subunit A